VNPLQSVYQIILIKIRTKFRGRYFSHYICLTEANTRTKLHEVTTQRNATVLFREDSH